MLLAVIASVGVTTANGRLDIKRETARAASLMEHGRYAEARRSLTLLRAQVPIDDGVVLRHIDFELVRCAAELHDNEAEKIMLAFLRRYPESVHVNEVRFMLAMYYCECERHSSARVYFDQVSYKALTDKEKEHYNMRMGYIEFKSGNYDKANQYFSALSPIGSYADHAKYYKSYIHYAQGNYDKAYEGFASLKNSENYAKVINYYLFQIEYARGNYDYVVSKGEELMKQSVDVERTALMRIIAESWYRKKVYNKSHLYMMMYKCSNGEMGRNENYILGYSAYLSKDYKTAEEALKEVIKGHGDELAQNASYHLAHCYVEWDKKKQAIDAFAFAADEKFEKFDKNISEDALFNYGKLLFETGGSKFNETINVLTRYVEKYSSSSSQSNRVEDAKKLLIAAYYNSKDYDMTYEALKAFPNPDVKQLTVLKKITYLRGLKALSEGDEATAKAKLEEASAIPVSPKYSALCNLWLGEIAYRHGEYGKAVEYFSDYIRRAPKNHDYQMALYNLGYAHFAKKDMANSQKAFKQFVESYTTKDRYLADAFNRMGDTQYSQRKYSAAAKSYESASEIGTVEQHYAKYQRAIALGLAGKTNAKIDVLKQMLDVDCGDYNDDAAYELGRAYVSLGQYANSASVLEKFVENQTQSPYYIPALFDLGLIHSNLGNSDKTLFYYDKIIVSAPQTTAAKEALLNLREIYVSKGDISSYFAYAERAGVECDLSAMTRDSLSFRSAQNIYLANRKTEAISHLNKYLVDYPKGFYTNDVLYLLSDCYLKTDSLPSAVKCMKQLVEQPKNTYTQPVVEVLARVTFENKMYEESAPAYRRMYDVVDSSAKRTEAANGYAESVILRKDGDALLVMASDLDTLPDVDSTMLRKVRFAKANVLAERNEVVEARKIYEELSADMTTAEGAESAYRIIEALFQEGKLDECEQKVYAMANSKTQHAYWLGKAFITLGDVYVQRNDTFQASATYRSVVDGYSPADDGIVAEAQAKLNKLN